MNGFDGPLVGAVDGQPRPENPHEYWVSCFYQAQVKRRKERFWARNSLGNARLGGSWNTAIWPQPAPTLASAADKEKASARLASSNWWARRDLNPGPKDYESAKGAISKHSETFLNLDKLFIYQAISAKFVVF